MNLSMNNPFESIRKLALSKLSQFKFIMTVVMYLAAVIPLLSLGYLMGRTSAESSKWLLDLSSLLGSIGSLLGGLATVFAAWVAFGAYGTWKKQITHPEMFQRDLKIINEINNSCRFVNNVLHEHEYNIFTRWVMYDNQCKLLDKLSYNYKELVADEQRRQFDDINKIKKDIIDSGFDYKLVEKLQKEVRFIVNHDEYNQEIIDYSFALNDILNCFMGFYDEYDKNISDGHNGRCKYLNHSIMVMNKCEDFSTPYGHFIEHCKRINKKYKYKWEI